MSFLTKKDKISLGLLVGATLSDMILVLLLSLHLNYSVTSKKNTSPQYTITPDLSCVSNESNAATNAISFNYSKAGAGLYTTAIAAILFCLGVLGLFGSKNIKKKNIADKAVLIIAVICTLCNIVLIVLLAIPLNYTVNSVTGKQPVFIVNPDHPNKAETKGIYINYIEGGAGVYSLAIIGFTASFTAFEVIWEAAQYKSKHLKT